MWRYDNRTGRLYHNGVYISSGYSGAGRGKNNPALIAMRGVGPIPNGVWKITARYNSANVGPYTLALDAIDARPGDDRHEGTGRTAFRIHGDSIKAPGTASRGCIILPRKIREQIWLSGDRVLEVYT